MTNPQQALPSMVKNWKHFPFYTLINSIAQKLWAIKPCPWPRTEFSSGGQESWHLFEVQQQPSILGARPGSFRTRWELTIPASFEQYWKPGIDLIPLELIKEDLGDHSEDPEKYIRAFKGVTMLYDLTWKDVMYIVGQMLTPDSKTRVLGKAVAYGDEWLGNESVGKREDNITALPTGKQAVPNTEPDWDDNTAKGRWESLCQMYSSRWECLGLQGDPSSAS